MKKFISLFLILCCAVSLFGCDALEKIGEVELPPVPTPAAMEESAEPASEAEVRTETEHQHIIINFDKTEQQAYDPQQGSQLILSFSYETPYVHIPANTNAEENINEYIAMLNESFYTGDTYGVVYDSECAPGYINMLTMAEDNYNYIINSALNLDSGWANFELANHRSVNLPRCDDRVLSLRYYDYINLGGVHGGYAYRGYNFNTASGELLTLESLSDDSESLKAFLKSYLLEQVNESAQLQERMMGVLDVEGMPTKEEALSALVREGSWYMDDNGMIIVSDLYELGPYAAGIFEFNIPYSELAAYIKPEYIPDAVTESGSFSLATADAGAEISKEIIDMLRIDEDGQSIYLAAEGTVRNVRLARVDYTDRFYETETLWQCSIMCDCALQLVTNVPEGMPELKISYSDAGGEHVFYLSQSGLDGSFILVDDSIEAVG